MSNLILIDSRVSGISDILSSLTSGTESLVFDFFEDTFESIQARIQKPYGSVAIIQHNSNFPVFRMLFSMEDACLKDVSKVEPELKTWSEFAGFLQWLKDNGASCVDLLACNLWADADWVYVIEQLRSKLELSIRASVDLTGADGNFVLESDNVDMIGLYFTEEILKYKYNFYTPSIYQGNHNTGWRSNPYTPYVFSASNPGYIPATAYSDLLGKTFSYSGHVDSPNHTHSQYVTDISNVSMVAMIPEAAAILLTNGNVICIGAKTNQYGDTYGGDSSEVNSELHNITKILGVETGWFSALRSDGRVFCWGNFGSWVGGVNPVNFNDISNQLVNVVNIYSNVGACFALTNTGSLIGWGVSSARGVNENNSTGQIFNSGIVKVLMDYPSPGVALKSNGVAYTLNGNGDSSAIDSVNSNPIVDVFVLNNVIYVRTTVNNTTQLTNMDGRVLYYEIPEGVCVTTRESHGWWDYILLSDGTLLNIVGSNCSVIDVSVNQLVANDYSYAYLRQDGEVIVNMIGWAWMSGYTGYGGNPYGETNGLPSGVTLTNVKRLFSTISSFGALKNDNTFVVWGMINDYTTFNTSVIPTTDSTLYSAISSNIKSVYSCNNGYIFVKTNGSIVRFGASSWQAQNNNVNGSFYSDMIATTNYGTKRANKNVAFLTNNNGFLPIEYTPASSYSVSQYMQYLPTTVTYYNNNPDEMAINGRKYSLMNGTTLIKTWICLADSFTYTFSDFVFMESGVLNLSIWDTTIDASSSLVTAFPSSTNIISNPSVSPPDAPIITNVAVGPQQLTISFSPPVWDGGLSILKYKYSVDQGVTYTILPASSTQILLTELTDSSYTIWISCSNLFGDSYYAETSTFMYSPPSAPSVSVNTGSRQIVLNVSTSDNGGGEITGYKYAFSSSGPFTSFTGNEYTISNLVNGNTYSLFVKATNGAGDSPATAHDPITLDLTVPDSPVITSVVPGDTTAKVIFTTPYNGGHAITAYKYILNNSVTDAAEVSISVVDSSFVITGLTNGTTYTVKMQAVNSLGTSDNSVVSSGFVPKTLPGSPTINSVTAGNRQVEVAFTAPASNGGVEITKYRYRLNGGAEVDVNGLESPFTIAGLTNGTSYTLRMTSVNASGESALSVASTSFIPSTTPSSPVIQSIVAGNQSITVNFTLDNGGRQLTSLEYSLNDDSNISIVQTSSPLVINGLTNGTQYRVKLRVSNQNGTSDMSAYSDYATPKTTPGAPSINSIQSGNQYVEITFSPPLDNGSSEITGYKYSLNGGAFSSVGLIQSPFRITNGIQNGTSYSVRLIATNIVGDSAATASSSSVIPCRVPDAPTIVSVQNGDKRFTIQLSAGNNGGSAILSYTYYIDDANPVVITSLSSPLEFSNLTIGTLYSFKIKATNSVGGSAYATSNFTGMSIPDAPVLIGATAGNNSIVLQFSDPNANSSSITGYKYSIANGTYLSAILLDSSHISITGLTANVEYSVKIAAVNAIGQSADSSSATATPYTYPIAPTIGTITVGNGSASIEFSPQSNNGSVITQYEYSLNNGNYILRQSVSSPLVLSNLSNGVAYTIRMKAINVAGSSVSASSASFMPRTIPEVPVIKSVTAGNQSCQVEFTPGFFNGATITKYRYSFNGTDFQDAIGTSSPITISGLTNGSTYMVYLLAINAVGESNISSPSSSFTPFVTQSTPNPPTISSVVAGISSVTVSFVEGTNTGSAIKGYMYSIDGGVTSLWAKQISSPLIIDGLENGVEQSIKICAVNNSGPSNFSVASNLFTPRGLPSAPIITGVQGADSSIVVSFIPSSSNGSTISSYEYSIDASSTYLTLPQNSTISGLNNGTSYNVKLRAINSVGTSSPSGLSASVMPYKAPSAPVISSVSAGDRTITISFTPGNTNGSVVSRYEYALVSNGVTGTFRIAPSVNSPFVITGLDNGIGYRVVLRAVSSLGAYSESSAVSDENTPGTVPVAPVITNLLPSNGAITVYWVANANGSPITSVLYNVNDGSYVDTGVTDASFAITGLVNGSSYSIRVIAVNTHGSSSPSSASGVVSPLSKPEPPTVISVVPGDSNAQIYLEPGNANGSSVIGYKYSLDGTSYKWVKDNTSPISIYGLNNGSSYNISLKTVGEYVGSSSAVALSSPVMPYSSPDAPVIQSISVGNASAVITFVDGNTNGLTLTGYKYSLDASNYMDISAVDQTITLTGLTNGSSYTVSLKSVSAVAMSAPSVLSAPFIPYTSPSIPVISRVVTGDQSASVYIVDGNANGSGVTQAYRYTFDNTNYFWASSSTSPIVISSGLVNNQGYRIRVATKTELGMSAYSAQSPTFVPYTLPGQPTITSVVAGTGIATLYFTDGSSNGRPITKYQYTMNGVTYSEVTGPSPLQLTGLTNGTSYTVTLKNANLAGYSPASLTSNVFTPFTVPSAPTITNLVPLANQIVVYVAPGNTNGSAITRYSYSLNDGSYVNTADATTSFVITGLTNGTSYTVAVKAENEAGVGAASATSTGVIPFTVPDAPTITGVTVGNGNATVAITNGNNNGREATQYQYTYTSSAGSTTLTTSTSDTQLSSILITGLTNWTSYTVTVKAINAAGMSSESSSSESFMPFNIPGAPIIASVVPGDRQLTVSIDGYTQNAGIIGYKYSLNQESFIYVSAQSSSFVISGLVNGQNYVVRVKSCTSLGDSPSSSEYSSIYPRTVPNVPTNVVVTPLNESAEIVFTDGSSNGAVILYYMYSLNGDIDTPIKKRDDGKLKIFGIANAINYTVRLRAVNSHGASSYSEVSNDFMPYGIPLVRPVITRILPGNGCAYIHFSAADTNGSVLIKFKCTDGKTTIDLSGTTSPVTVPNLANKKVASISIASCNMVGNSPFTTPILITPGVPLAPVITSVVAYPQKLLVYFDAPENNGFPITSYMYGYVGSSAFVKATSESPTSASPLMLLGLKNGTAYNVQIKASNLNGISEASNSLGNRIPCAPPAKIVITSVTSLLDGGLIAFTAPINNGATLLKYKYALNSDTTYTDISGLTLPLRIYGISPNTLNTVKVISTNLAGDSLESLPSKPFTFVYLPPAQVKVTALTIALNQLTVAFLPPAPNGAPVTGYKYALNDSTTFLDISGLSLPLIIRDGILPNVNYNVRIIAVNNAGLSVASLPVAKPVIFVYLPPLAPTITNIVAGNQSALVTFTGLPARGAPITGYAYTLDASATTVYDVSGAVSSLTINGLTNNTLYNVRVAAITLAGNSAWSAVKPVTPVYKVPDKPLLGTVTAGNGQLTVAFTPPAANGSTISGYKYTLNGGEKVEIISLLTGGKSFVIAGLTNGTVYNVQICATNFLGDSDLSLGKAGTPKV